MLHISRFPQGLRIDSQRHGCRVDSANSPTAEVFERRFIRSIPRDEVEAALIDCADPFRILSQVLVLPIQPALIILRIISFVGTATTSCCLSTICEARNCSPRPSVCVSYKVS